MYIIVKEKTKFLTLYSQTKRCWWRLIVIRYFRNQSMFWRAKRYIFLKWWQDGTHACLSWKLNSYKLDIFCMVLIHWNAKKWANALNWRHITLRLNYQFCTFSNCIYINAWILQKYMCSIVMPYKIFLKKIISCSLHIKNLNGAD